MAARRTALFLILVIGVVLVIFPFATNLFSKTSSAEHLTDTFRPTFSNTGLAQMRSDINGVSALSNQLLDPDPHKGLVAALPGALGMSNKQFTSTLTTNWPDVAAGAALLPTAVPRFNTLVSGLEAQQQNFKKADAIPVHFLPITIVPWLVLIPGLVLAVLGAIALRRKDNGLPALIASLVVGVVLAGAAVGLNLYAKGRAVDHLGAALQPFFTADGAAKSRSDLTTIEKMATQFTTQTVPTVQKLLGMNDAQFGAFLTKNFPDVAAGVAALPQVLPRFDAAVNAVSANEHNFTKTRDIPFSWMATSTVFWWFLLPGLVLILIPAVIWLSGDVARTALGRNRVARGRLV